MVHGLHSCAFRGEFFRMETWKNGRWDFHPLKKERMLRNWVKKWVQPDRYVKSTCEILQNFGHWLARKVGIEGMSLVMGMKLPQILQFSGGFPGKYPNQRYLGTVFLVCGWDG